MLAAVASGTVLVAACSGSLIAFTIALVIAGAANAPTLIVGNSLVTKVVPAHAATEAYTWLGATVFTGLAIGAPLDGTVFDQFGAHAALWAATAAGVAVLLTAHRPPPTPRPHRPTRPGTRHARMTVGDRHRSGAA